MRIKKIVTFVILSLILFSSTTSCANQFNHTTFNEEFLNVINQERELQGVDKLDINNILIDLANQRSFEMAEYGNLRYVDSMGKELAHVRPDGRIWNTVFTDNDVKFYGSIGENMAQIYIWDSNLSESVLANRLFQLWKSSSGHYANMISNDYSSMGIGFSTFKGKDGVTYAISTNLFATMNENELRGLSGGYKPVAENKDIPIAEVPELEIKPVYDEPMPVIPIEEIKPPTDLPEIISPISKQACPHCHMHHDCETMQAVLNLILWNNK